MEGAIVEVPALFTSMVIVPYQFATRDKKGKTITEKGTYVTVWKKQPDGTWKVVGDIHNTNA